MGVRLTRLCSQKDQEENERDLRLKKSNEDLLSIIEDYDYFNTYIACDDSINNSLFDHDKFLLSYTDFQFHQQKMKNHWKAIDFANIPHGDFLRRQNEVLAPQWKFLIRKGVPFEKIRSLVLDVVKRLWENNNSEYKIVLNSIFGENVPGDFKNTPTFCEKDDISEVLSFTVLNEEGQKSLKRILWIFKETCPNLEYSPLLVQTASLLLIFLNESETYFTTNILLEESKKFLGNEQNRSSNERSLRWHFSFYKEDFVKFCKVFFKVLKSRSKTLEKLEKHFADIGFDHYDMFQEWSQNFFLGFLKFSTVIRIFVLFINEGIKIHYRVSYALCKIFKKQILSFKNPLTIKEDLRRLTLMMNNAETAKMFRKCFSLGLKKLKRGYSKMKVDVEGKSKAKTYYLPHLEKSSEIASSQKFETIWEYLPSLNKILDPKLVFSSSRDGFSLAHVYKKCEEYIDQPMVLLIQTDKNYVFGAYSDCMLKLENQLDYYGGDESFIFLLEPKEVKFSSKLKNKCHIHSNLDYFSFGSGNLGCAFQIDAELYQGHTYVSETYENEPLNGESYDSSFKCIKIEIYALE